jgi:hypothetical protein
MIASAVLKANQETERAAVSLETMKSATDRQDFARAWSDFLSASHRTFSKLEQAAKTSGTSKAWFGRKVHDRRNDPLLSYIHHARNVDEHGLEDSASPGYRLGNPRLERVAEYRGRATRVVNYVFRDIHADGSTSVLHPVVDRGVTYPPPDEHMGTPIENPSAVIVGDLAIAYLQAMVAEALRLSQ